MLLQLDVTFPALACSVVSLDAMDISGEQHLDVVRVISLVFGIRVPVFPCKFFSYLSSRVQEALSTIFRGCLCCVSKLTSHVMIVYSCRKQRTGEIQSNTSSLLGLGVVLSSCFSCLHCLSTGLLFTGPFALYSFFESLKRRI
jgi:hypothetical protein